jgi:hypothetical protein
MWCRFTAVDLCGVSRVGFAGEDECIFLGSSTCEAGEGGV